MTDPTQFDPQRRARLTAEVTAATGIDEPMIRLLVHAFYDRIRHDSILGPIFSARITAWDQHLERMCTFWSSVALMSGRYQGQPMQKHLPLPVDARHFDHWLALWEKTVRAVCPPAAVDHFIEPARRIASSLELGIASAHGQMLAKGQRFSLTNDAP